MRLTVEVGSVESLSRILQRFEQIRDIYEVRRDTPIISKGARAADYGDGLNRNREGAKGAKKGEEISYFSSLFSLFVLFAPSRFNALLAAEFVFGAEPDRRAGDYPEDVHCVACPLARGEQTGGDAARRRAVPPR